MKRLWLAGLALAAAWNCTTEQDNVFAACQVTEAWSLFTSDAGTCTFPSHDGKPPLSRAAHAPSHSCSPAVMQLLMRAILGTGANVDAVDANGDTALHVAVGAVDVEDEWELLPVVALLLQAGADPNITNVREESPLQIARFRELALTGELLNLAVWDSSCTGFEEYQQSCRPRDCRRGTVPIAWVTPCMNDPCPTAWTADIRCDEKCPGGAALDGTHSMDNATGWPRGVCKWCKEGSGWDKDAATCRVCKSDETVLEGLCCKEGEWVRDGACFSCPAGEKWTTECARKGVYDGGCMPSGWACDPPMDLWQDVGYPMLLASICVIVTSSVCCGLARCVCPGRQADLIAAVKRRCGCSDSSRALETLCCCAQSDMKHEADTGVAAKSSSAPCAPPRPVAPTRCGPMASETIGAPEQQTMTDSKPPAWCKNAPPGGHVETEYYSGNLSMLVCLVCVPVFLIYLCKCKCPEFDEQQVYVAPNGTRYEKGSWSDRNIGSGDNSGAKNA